MNSEENKNKKIHVTYNKNNWTFQSLVYSASRKNRSTQQIQFIILLSS
jgi:hypothetical protein